MALVALNLRELWMSFRLLLILAVLLGSALVVVLASLSAPGLPASATYAVSLALATIVVAAAAAYTVAADRGDGWVAWLAVRAVKRSSLLLAWLAAFVPPLLAGLAISATVAWLTLAHELAATVTPAAFALTVLAVAAAAFAAVALGVMFGTFLPSWRAALMTALLLLAAVAATMLLPVSTPLPSGGFTLLGSLPSVERPIAMSLAAIGSALVAIAVLAIGAAAFLQRIDL